MPVRVTRIRPALRAALAAAPALFFLQAHSLAQVAAGADDAARRAAPPAWAPAFEFAIEGEADAVAAAGATGVRDAEGPLIDAAVRLEAEAVSPEGLRYGARLEGRARRDSGRRDLAGPGGACVGLAAGCGRVGVVSGAGATPPQDAVRGEIAVAEVFVKGALAELALGYGPGAAAREAAALPGAFRLMRADAPRVDAAGVLAAHTLNDLSAHAAKLTLRSARLYGVRASASFTPDPARCGIAACTGFGAPPGSSLENAVELAVSVDHRFRGSGLRVSASLDAARAEREGVAAPGGADPWATSARLTLDRGAWSAGAGYLESNDGYDDARYRAASLALAREAGPWLAAIELGAAESGLSGAESLTAQLGASRLVGERAVIGAGVLLADQAGADPGTEAGARDVQASRIFLEAGLRF